jgi:23S rRNA (cytosine1962-C5)-methyltransferase
MPGLIIDWYNGTAVIQCHSKGMNAEKEKFVELLKEGYGERLEAVYDKSAATLHHKFEEKQEPESENSKSLPGRQAGEIRNPKYKS